MKKYIFLFLFFFISGASFATFFAKRLTLEEKVKGATLIIEAKCQDIKEKSKEKDKGLPYIYYSFKILDVLKGEYKEKTIELSRLKSPKTIGVKFEKHDEGMLFLKKSKNKKHWIIVGVAQGFYKYSKEKNKLFAKVEGKKKEKSHLIDRVKKLIKKETDEQKK